MRLPLLMLFPFMSVCAHADNLNTSFSSDSITEERPKPCIVVECPSVPRGRKKESVWKEFSYFPLPIFASSFIVKANKENFRGARNNFHKGYESEWDNYIQYSPFALTLALKAAQVENHSKWGRMLASSALSYAAMAAFTNAMKYTIKEQRPDGSTKNSFPSGHTATAFASATILHKEYGLTRSPWYSVCGYAIATTTGIMRVLNNRHWASDILAGAAIGIFSVDLGYFLGDIIFKDKHIIRPYREDNKSFYTSPSFFNLNVGYGLLEHKLDFGKRHLKSSRPITSQLEFAYYFNPYIGAGARLNVASPLVTDGDYSDYLGIYSLTGGAYGTYPITPRFAIGGKMLFGRVATSSFTFDDGLSCDKGRAFAFGFGANIAYAYRNNIAWRFNVDYDTATPRFTAKDNGNEYSFKTSLHQLTLSASMSVMF